MIVGIATVFFSLPVVFDAAKYRCQLSRVRIDDANTDKKDWNNVDTGGQKAGDVPCADAVRLAPEIPLNQKGKKFPLPSESALAAQNGVAVALGIGQAISGFSVIRTLNRRARLVAIVLSSIAGFFFPVLSLLSIGVLVFVAYAFGFSPAAREVWPREVRG
ncbi:MAG TPA: hypothetical protein VJS45_00555 [Acidimicrobiia bacterium]|jgi:hypothetical protein|nr:hypothetical protein [Acidimicrobiia bacterium]